MKYSIIIITFFLVLSCAKKEKIEPSHAIENIVAGFQNASSILDPVKRQEKIDAIWDSLTINNLIPITEDSTALFLYRGEAESVSWNGDFNGWSGNKSIETFGEKIPGTDIWMLKKNFPADARLDYKITIDTENWILDPVNPNQQWSGFGPNSELRMPDWKEEPLKTPIEEASKGTMSSTKLIASKNLGYQVQYRVYIPAGYEKFRDLPVLYTTDGQEYSDEKLGAAPIVLDNLIHMQRIQPVIAVFVEPLNPDNTDENRRMDEMGMSEEYLSFFVDELIPKIEEEYKVKASKENRVILGTSLGGLNAAYFAFSRPDIFDGAAIQAPAFWYREGIYDLVRNAKEYPSNIYMSVGTIGDNTLDARTMKKLFEEKEIDFSYLEVNEGHSWGAWSAQMDDILVQFFGNREE